MQVMTCKAKRAGVAIVEAAVVLPIFLFFLYGIMEYARFIFVLQVTQNATRTGARLAIVSTGSVTSNPATATATTNLIKNRVLTLLGGAQNSISGYTCEVFKVDEAKLIASPPTVDALNPSSPESPPRWFEAGFGERIGVRVRGTYRPVVRSMPLPAAGIVMPLMSDVPINITSVMLCEAN